MPDSSPHVEPEFVMPSHETLRAWCVRARSGEGSPYVHISPDELEGLLEQYAKIVADERAQGDEVERLQEQYQAALDTLAWIANVAWSSKYAGSVLERVQEEAAKHAKERDA